MRMDKLGKELEMIRLLASPEDYTVKDICEITGVSKRNFYYYLHFFRDNGFILFKHNRCYHIDRRSPFLNKMLDLLQFTEDEAVTLRRLLTMVGENNPVVNGLKAKLDRFYDFSILADMESRKKAAKIVNTLYEAIKQKRVVKLEGYSSPHSMTVRDRFVEPYLLMNNNNDVRCYEPLTDQCKTFRISRMDRVVMMDLKWSGESKHTQVFTDIFMFSGDTHRPVRLLLGQLARNVFVEEHPAGAKLVVPDGNGRWLLEVEVCDYRGIGRFVLGLFDDIEILGDDAFKAYIYNKVEAMQARLAGK